MPSFKLSAALVATAIFSLNAQAQYSIDPNSVPLATRRVFTFQSAFKISCWLLQKTGAKPKFHLVHCFASKIKVQMLRQQPQMTAMLWESPIFHHCASFANFEQTTLTYDCVCGNGYTPNVANYSQTIPFFECQEYGNQCVNSCGSGDTACQSACRDDHPCGAQNPTRINATSTSSTISSTGVPAGATSGTAGVVFTGLGGGAVATATSASSGSSTSSASSDTKKSGSKAVLDVGRSYGLAIVLAGVFAGFALIM